MARNGCDVNQLDSDLLLPPRKRLLAGFKKQNSNGSSSSSTSYSNGSSSSSASTVVQTHLDDLLTSSQLNDDKSGSPEELKAAAESAVKIAKAARAAANEKAVIAAEAVAAAKNALELFASFPVKERRNKQKKHVPVHVLYSKDEDDLARRLNRAINKYSPGVLTEHRSKKLKSVATYENSAVTSSTMYGGNDVAGVVDSDTSTDDEVGHWGKRRGRVKLKKLPLSISTASKDQENRIITKSLAQTGGSSGGVAQVRS